MINQQLLVNANARAWLQTFLSISAYICLYRYGDKAPKSSLARSFAVVWIIIGVTVCSVMTATLSNALTNVKIEKFDVTTGKRVMFLLKHISP